MSHRLCNSADQTLRQTWFCLLLVYSNTCSWKVVSWCDASAHTESLHDQRAGVLLLWHLERTVADADEDDRRSKSSILQSAWIPLHVADDSAESMQMDSGRSMAHPL